MFVSPHSMLVMFIVAFLIMVVSSIAHPSLIKHDELMMKYLFSLAGYVRSVDVPYQWPTR
jgi:hypothetical protein